MLWTVFSAAGEELAANVDAHDAETAARGFEVNAIAKVQDRRLTGDSFARVNFETGEIVEDIETAKDWALAVIDRRRSTAIAKHLGPTAEIRELHRDKAGEAARFEAGDSLDPDRSLLIAEAEETGRNLSDVAADVAAQASAARAAIRTIEGQAMAAKSATRAAETVAAVKQAMEVLA